MAAARAAALGAGNEELTTVRGLPPGELHVWTIALEASPSRRDALRAVLGPEELERAARFRHPRDAARYITAHGALRHILASYADAAPDRLAFQRASHGKPVLTEPHAALHFNLSDADDLALVGVAAGSPVGIDLEAIHPVSDLDDVARDHFSSAELAALRDLPESERLAGFYRCWTRKEAFIKALGEGLSHPLASFTVSVSPDAASRVEGWTVAHLDPAPGFVGAWAMRGTPVVRVQSFEP